MGEVANDADLQALKAETVRAGVPVVTEWQVTVAAH